ncbi:MAG: 4-hydroxy-tetrahydrodipicolinate reductase [Desulfovibrionaceae bacterium]
MSTNIIVMGAGGRMGRIISELVMADANLTLAGVVERPGHQSALECYDCTKSTDLDALLGEVKNAVVINFTAPEATVDAAAIAARHGAAFVAGTTGLSAEQKAKLAEYAAQIPLVFAPNMSVGVNVLLKILPQLVQLLGEQYDLEMVELHHNRKADAPSGTALRLAECLAEARGWDLDETGTYCRHGIIGARPQKEIGVQTIRGGDVVGVHTVYFMGQGERIEVTHQAHSREMFAQGAIRAAKWLAGRPAGKLYAMTDVLADA